MSLLFPVDVLDDEALLQLAYDRLAARFALGPAVVRLSSRKLTGGEIAYGQPHRITISAHFWRLARQLGARRGPAPETEALRRFREKRNVVYRCEGCLALFRRFRAFRSARYCISCHRKGRPARLRRVDDESRP